jgi:hypothetical protein
MAPISNITKRGIYRIMIYKQLKPVIPSSTVHSLHVLHFAKININKTNCFKTYDHIFQDSKRLAGLESREYGRRDPSRWPRGTFYPQKLPLTSPTSGGPLVGIVRLRTQTTEFSFKRC